MKYDIIKLTPQSELTKTRIVDALVEALATPYIVVVDKTKGEQMPSDDLEIDCLILIEGIEKIQIPEIKENKIKMNDHPAHFNDSDIIEFITNNSAMSWNTVCSFVMKHRITSDDGHSKHWDRVEIPEDATDEYIKSDYSEPVEAIRWMSKFFKANPTVSELYFSFR